MYRVSIPRNKVSVLSILDSLIASHSVEIPDIQTSRHVGMYLKPWRRKGFISLYIEPEQKRTVLISNVDIERSIGRGKRIDFTIDDSLIRSIYPRLPRL